MLLLLLQVVKQIEAGLLEKSYTAAGGIIASQETRSLCLIVQRLSLNSASAGSSSSSSLQDQHQADAATTPNRCSFFDDFEEEEETLEDVHIHYSQPVRPKVSKLLYLPSLLLLLECYGRWTLRELLESLLPAAARRPVAIVGFRCSPWGQNSNIRHGSKRHSITSSTKYIFASAVLPSAGNWRASQSWLSQRNTGITW